MNSAAEELGDVLDGGGRVIGVVTRAEMRRRKLPHRCVYLLVFNSRRQLFVHLRTPTKDVYPSHRDVAVGGVVAAGESWDEAARREGREELGVELQAEPLFPFRFVDDRTDAHGMVYRVVHDGPFLLQPEEVVRGEFHGVEEALACSAREPFCPDGLAVLQEYLRRSAGGGAS